MKLIALLISVAPFYSFGQDTLLSKIFPVTNGKVIYEQTVSFAQSSKENIYKKVKKWAIANQPVINASFNEDKDLGMISTNGSFFEPIAFSYNGKDSMRAQWQYWYKLTIDFSDSTVDVKIDNIQFSGYDKNTVLNIEEYDHDMRMTGNAFRPVGPGRKTYDKTMKGIYNAIEGNLSSANNHILNSLIELKELIDSK